ncbi:decorin-like [Branchiostoma floridae]|uniref:Decorin-like n=1 Tax=Branchiostoma floridae TaxID=7739 RepID=A0A9J7LA27_BRAFL|nr:decorin-like [Branchiostoma floridae]
MWMVFTVHGQPRIACDSEGDESPACICWSETVSCQDADLTAVPSDIPPDTIVLKLSRNKISSLPKMVFGYLPPLSTLNLRYNKMSYIEAGAFDGEIGLNDNKLESLDEDIFKDLRRLQTIRLEDNEIKRLPSGIFSEANLEDLLILNLHENDLTVIENGTFDNLPSIQSISLEENLLMTVDCGMVPSQNMSASLGSYSKVSS